MKSKNNSRVSYKALYLKERKHKRILTVCSYVLLGLTFLAIWIAYNGLFANPDLEPTINTSELTSGEKNLVNRTINDLHPLFLKGHKSIHFTDNITEYQPIFKEEREGYILAGLNVLNRIYINNDLLWNENQLRQTLCHEAIHSYAKHDDHTHEIIDYLAKKEVCYKNSKKLNRLTIEK